MVTGDTNVLRIDSALVTHMPEVGPGVRGHAFEENGELWITVLVAEVEGAGDVARYLDGLPADRRIVVPTVISGRLAGMLARRGFALEKVVTFEGEHVDAFVRGGAR